MDADHIGAAILFVAALALLMSPRLIVMLGPQDHADTRPLSPSELNHQMDANLEAEFARLDAEEQAINIANGPGREAHS